MGEKFTEAFLDAAKTVLLDAFARRLYRDPTVSARMLKKYFRQELWRPYLTAVFLADQARTLVHNRKKNILRFSVKINSAKKSNDINQILAVLLKDFMDVLPGRRSTDAS